MAIDRAAVLAALTGVNHPAGGNIVDKGLVRALNIDGGEVRFVIEAASAAEAQGFEPVRQAAHDAAASVPGVAKVTAVLTAHGPAPGTGAAPPQLKIGGHAKPQPAGQQGPQRLAGIDRILAIGSGKGGVGKSTVATNLAVALAKEGRRVGLLDADIYGPSVPKMMGVSERPKSSGGKIIEPLHAHGVTMMSIGLMVDPDKAIVWRGPMLMGALQQLLTQVNWGKLDVLIIDLPPGTGDVQLSLCQRTHLTGAIVVSTPQDVALIDARKAVDMFNTLKTPVLGMIENMSLYICPNCGHEAHLFGHGGVATAAAELDLPLLGTLPIDLDTRIGGDEGRPIATGTGIMANAYGQIARGLISGDMA